MCHLDQALHRHGIRVDPGALYVGEKHLRRLGHAKARVDATPAFIDEVELRARDAFHAVARRRRRCRGGACRGQRGRRGGRQHGRGELEAAVGTLGKFQQLRSSSASAHLTVGFERGAGLAQLLEALREQAACRDSRGQRTRVTQRDERHARVAVRVGGPGRQPGGALGEGHDGTHQANRKIHRERLLGAIGEQVRVAEQAQHESVAGVGQIHGGHRLGVLKPHAPLRARGPPQHGVGGRREGRLEAGVLGLQRAQLRTDAEKFLVVRVHRVLRRPLALLHDRRERLQCGLEARDVAGTAELHLRGRELQRLVAIESVGLTVALDEGAQPLAQCLVKGADGVVVEGHGRQPGAAAAAHVGTLVGETRALGFGRAVGALEEYEVLQRVGVEGSELHHHARR